MAQAAWLGFGFAPLPRGVSNDFPTNVAPLLLGLLQIIGASEPGRSAPTGLQSRAAAGLAAGFGASRTNLEGEGD